VPKHYIIWLLISVLLAVKAFAFSRFRRAGRSSAAFPVAGGGAAGPLFQAFDAGEKTFVNP
jgi:hypothetical protein